jgi:hypothetical protein
MEMMMDLLIQFWPIVLGFVALIVWLVRLEARAMDNTKEIKRLWAQRKEDLGMSKEARDDTNKMLAEMRDDIKSLLVKVGNGQ